MSAEAMNRVSPKRFGECDREEKICKLAECGLVLEDPSTWTDENCTRFGQRNPGYEVAFEDRSRVIHSGADVDFRNERLNLVVLPAGMYERKMNFGHSDEVGYGYFRLRTGLGDDVKPEAPFNVVQLYNTFSYSDAKRIDISGWDLRDCSNVEYLFTKNCTVEEIDMRGVKFPVAEERGWLDKTDFRAMFKGCSNLKRLYLKTGPSNCIFTCEDYIQNQGLNDCFEGCKNLEYVYFDGGPFWEAYLHRIVNASEKRLTIDGKFLIEDWVRYHGGIWLGEPIWGIFGDEKVDPVKEPGRTDINFIGKVIKSSIEGYEALVDLINEKNKFLASDYELIKRYLQELKENKEVTV